MLIAGDGLRHDIFLPFSNLDNEDILNTVTNQNDLSNENSLNSQVSIFH